MLVANYPNNRVTVPIRYLHTDGTDAPRPADLQIQASNLYVWVQENTPGMLTIGPTNAPGTSESVVGTITISSASLGLSDAATVTFNGPTPPVPAQILDIDEPAATFSTA